MALTMMDKQAQRAEKREWPPELKAEFEREAKYPNPCVGSELLSENERCRVWTITLKPGERIGGSIAGNVLATLAGADIVRVHDVAETVQALRVTDAIQKAR